MGTCLSTPQPTESLEILLQRPQEAGVKSILIRHTFPERARTNMNSQFLERSHILKYNPKYYHNLTLQVEWQNRLFSKIKKIKKLKKFTGFFKDPFPQKLWFNLLANSRKDIEQIPQITCKQPLRTRLGDSLHLQKIKFFYNVKAISEWNRSVSLKESFVKFLWGMRQLETLAILMTYGTCDETKRVIKKLSRMRDFLCRLKALSISFFQISKKKLQGFTLNKTFFSYVTMLYLDSEFDPVYIEMLKMSKNLKLLSLDFFDSIHDEFYFVKFLRALQSLSQLEELRFPWPKNVRESWSYLKPQSSLRYLSLIFRGSDLMNDNIEPKETVGHWESLEKLEALQLFVSYSKPPEMQNARRFIIMILEKAPNLRSLKLCMQDYLRKGEYDGSFGIENLPHLYESLEMFEYRLHHRINDHHFAKVDLGLLKPFRKLKRLKVDGSNFYCENVEEAVRLLEENQKEGEISVLEITRKGMREEQDWLGEILQKIQKIKRKDKNLKLIFNLTFETNNSLKLMEKLCKDIKAAKIIKGLEIDVIFQYVESFYEAPIEKVRKTLGRYWEIDNLRVSWKGNCGRLECVKVGEKAELYLDLLP